MMASASAWRCSVGTLFALVLLSLAATPVSLQIDLSEATKARVGTRVRELIEQRLLEEDFVVESSAALRLSLEELHGTIRLTARCGGEVFTRTVAPSGIAWRDELSFELAQRLSALAHEAAGLARGQEARVEAPEPVAEPEPEPPPVAPRLHLGAGFRAGVNLRFPSVDPTLDFHGALLGHAVEPLVLMGVTFAPGAGLAVWEVPIAVGLRVPIPFTRWSLIPEALAGARLHLFTASAVDAGGARVDLLGLVGLSVLRHFGALKVGLRVGLELGSPREHLLGDQLLWSRGIVGFSTQLQLER